MNVGRDALPSDFHKGDVSDDSEIEVLAHGALSSPGACPASKGPEAGMAEMLEGGMREDPTHRIIDVGEAVLAGYPAAAAVLTYCIERKNLT